MNALSALLGFIIVILVGLIAFYFGAVKSQVALDPLAKNQLGHELALMQLPAAAPPAQKADPQVTAEVEAYKQEIEALKAEREFAQQQAILAAQSVAEPVVEAPLVDTKAEERLRRRARQISKAFLIAQVDSFAPGDGFAVIRVINTHNVQPTVKLAIRRNSGIVGQLEVSRVEGDQAIADVLTHTFLSGAVDIQVGDELILPPF